ncbi:hypothetical protein C8R44DRAFT_846924 [Mycena epipterygia]|nr:hypothetical protein C8R44DRAFT_846924 [Mycena epipterygia]
MDPITATTTIITLATFIKDLIDLGQSIKESIEKVTENRRRIRDLTNEILHTLPDLANLSRGHEDEFEAPALLSALGNLKADMLHVLSTCRKISPAERSPGLRGLGVQIKVWIKRDDVEAEIKHLKEHVNQCYSKFTVRPVHPTWNTCAYECQAFSAARIEMTTARIEDHAVNTTLRVEQTLILNNAENQVRLQRLEGMMAQVLLETQFGQNIMNQTIEIIASDATHKTLEFQYLSTQALRLIDRLQQLAVNHTFILDAPLWDVPLQLPTYNSPEHILYNILGLLLTTNGCPAEIGFSTIRSILDLANDLGHLQMKSEAIAWHLMTIQILRQLAGASHTDILLQLAISRHNLACEYQFQLHRDLAIQSSQQSVDLCHGLCEISIDVDYQPLLLTTLITYSDNLREAGQPEIALSTAQEAVTMCRPMVGQIIESGLGLASWTEEIECKAVRSFEALFTFARALSSVDRKLEAYESWKEGFQTVLRFSGTRNPQLRQDIDSFLDQICKLAEAEEFSLTMLADCMILFSDLAWIYPEDFSLQFLRLLYAYVYLQQESDSQDSGSLLKNLRIFLELNSQSPMPVLKTPSNFALNIDCEGSVIEGAIWAFYFTPWTWRLSPLIKGIFIGHFDQAATTLQKVVSFMTHNPSSDSNRLDWTLNHISFHILPVIPHPKQVILLELIAKNVGHFWEITKASETASEKRSFSIIVANHFGGLWFAGLLDDALVVSDEALKYLGPTLNTNYGDSSVLDQLRYWRVFRTAVFFDMGRIDQAIHAAHEAKTVYPDLEQMEDYFPSFCLIQIYILQHTAKHQEAVQMLQRLIPILKAGKEEDELTWHILLAEFAAVRGHTGQVGKAVKDAEKAVLACRKDMANVKNQKFALVHSLTTLSTCLAAVGRNTEALMVAREATSIYNLNASNMWRGFALPFRRQGLGAKAFLSLSLQLATLGQLEEALENSKKATELFREWVLLVPVNLPSLAISLQNQASILWNICHQDEAISVCREAVTIMQQVAKSETYFLAELAAGLIQLALYLSDVGDNNGASAATSECEEVRKKIALLPPQPDFLFEEVVQEPEDETCEPEEILENTIFLALAESEVAGTTDSTVSEAATVLISLDLTPTAQEPQAPVPEEHTPETDNSAKGCLADLLAEVKIKLNSTAMNALWWILLGVLFAVVWIRIRKKCFPM